MMEQIDCPNVFPVDTHHREFTCCSTVMTKMSYGARRARAERGPLSLVNGPRVSGAETGQVNPARCAGIASMRQKWSWRWSSSGKSTCWRARVSPALAMFRRVGNRAEDCPPANGRQRRWSRPRRSRSCRPLISAVATRSIAGQSCSMSASASRLAATNCASLKPSVERESRSSSAASPARTRSNRRRLNAGFGAGAGEQHDGQRFGRHRESELVVEFDPVAARRRFHRRRPARPKRARTEGRCESRPPRARLREWR